MWHFRYMNKYFSKPILTSIVNNAIHNMLGANKSDSSERIFLKYDSFSNVYLLTIQLRNVSTFLLVGFSMVFYFVM